MREKLQEFSVMKKEKKTSTEEKEKVCFQFYEKKFMYRLSDCYSKEMETVMGVYGRLADEKPFTQHGLISLHNHLQIYSVLLMKHGWSHFIITLYVFLFQTRA